MDNDTGLSKLKSIPSLIIPTELLTTFSYELLCSNLHFMRFEAKDSINACAHALGVKASDIQKVEECFHKTIDLGLVVRYFLHYGETMSICLDSEESSK